MYILSIILLLLLNINTLSASELDQEQKAPIIDNKTIILKTHLIKNPQQNTTYIYNFISIKGEQSICEITFEDDFTDLIADIKNGIVYDHKMKIKSIYNGKNLAFISPMEFKMWLGRTPSGIAIRLQNSLTIPENLIFKKNEYEIEASTFIQAKFWQHDTNIIERLEENIKNPTIKIKTKNQIHKYPTLTQKKLTEIHKSFMLANEKSLQNQASETCAEIRAHYLAEELFKLGFYPMKAWVHKKDKTTHVSILLELENNENKKTFIIYDPWTDNNQTPVKEWAESNNYTEITISSFHRIFEHFVNTNHEAYLLHKNSLDTKHHKELQALRQTLFLDHDSFYGTTSTLQTPQITYPEKSKRYEYTYQANGKPVTCTILLEGDWSGIKTIDLQNGIYFKKDNHQPVVNGHWGYQEGNYVSREEYKKFFNQEKIPDLILKHENLIVFPNLIRLQRSERNNNIINFWFQYQEKFTTTFWNRGNIASRINSELKNNMQTFIANYIPKQQTIKDEKELRLIFRKFMQTNKEHLDTQYSETTDLCICRAHYVSQNLFKLGFYPYKIWKYWNYEDWKKYVKDQSWSYHVAVLIEVKTDDPRAINGKKRLIFDPWVSGHELRSIEEWINYPNEPHPVRIYISSFHQLNAYPVYKLPTNHEGYIPFLQDSKSNSSVMEKLNKYPFITDTDEPNLP